MGRAWAIAIFASAVGCARGPVVIIAGVPDTRSLALEQLVDTSPLAPDQNIRVTKLWEDESMSCHLVEIRDREVPHAHVDHDLTVTVLRGSGDLFVKGKPHRMRRGDSAIVPRETPHHFVNREAEPAVAFVTFAPAHDGTDQVLVQP